MRVHLRTNAMNLAYITLTQLVVIILSEYMYTISERFKNVHTCVQNFPSIKINIIYIHLFSIISKNCKIDRHCLWMHKIIIKLMKLIQILYSIIITL